MAHTEPKRALPAGRIVASVGVTVGALVLVSLATRAGSAAPTRPPGWSAVADAGRHGLIGLAVALTPILIVAGSAMWLTALVLARARRMDEARRDPAAARRRRIIVALGFVALLVLIGLDQRGYVHLRIPQLPSVGGGGAAAGVHTRGPGGAPVSRVDYGIATVIWAALAVAVIVLGRRWLRRRGLPRPAMAGAAAEPEIAAAPTDYEALRADPDPRRAVIAAYAGMERTLAGRDLPRVPAEGPREYLGRIVDTLRRSRPAAGRLTGLYERARFSQRPVDPRMQQAAVDALESVDTDAEERP